MQVARGTAVGAAPDTVPDTVAGAAVSTAEDTVAHHIRIAAAEGTHDCRAMLVALDVGYGIPIVARSPGTLTAAAAVAEKLP